MFRSKLEMDAVGKLMILNGGSNLLYSGAGWLQYPSHFKIQDEYSENRDLRLYLALRM